MNTAYLLTEKGGYNSHSNSLVVFPQTDLAANLFGGGEIQYTNVYIPFFVYDIVVSADGNVSFGSTWGGASNLGMGAYGSKDEASVVINEYRDNYNVVEIPLA